MQGGFCFSLFRVYAVYAMETSTKACPFCQSSNIRRYAYGLLGFRSPEERKKFLEGHILGGCAISPDAPLYRCEDCKRDFGRMDGK